MKGNGPTAAAAGHSGFRQERPGGHAPGARAGCDGWPEDDPRAAGRSGRFAATDRTGPPRARAPCPVPACRPGNPAPSLAGLHRPRCTDRPAIRPSADTPPASDQRAQPGHAGDRTQEQPAPAPAAQRSGGSEWSVSHACYLITFCAHCRQSTTAVARTRRFQTARAESRASRSGFAAAGLSVSSGKVPILLEGPQRAEYVAPLNGSSQARSVYGGLSAPVFQRLTFSPGNPPRRQPSGVIEVSTIITATYSLTSPIHVDSSRNPGNPPSGSQWPALPVSGAGCGFNLE